MIKDMNVQDVAMKLAVTWKVAAAAAAIPDVAEDDPLQIKVCGFDWLLPVLGDHSRGKSANRSQLRKATPFIGRKSGRQSSNPKNPKKTLAPCAKAKPAQAPNGNAGAAAQQDGTDDIYPFQFGENMGEAWKLLETSGNSLPLMTA